MMTQLMFFSGSKDVPAGFGSNEIISDDDRVSGKFDELNGIKNWRHMLSNFYPAERNLHANSGDMCPCLFELDGVRWLSVEHYFHAQKMKLVNIEYANSFALDSGSELSRMVGAKVKSAGRKIKLSAEQIAQWDNMKRECLRRALWAKFSQNEELKRVLLLTRDAILTHRPPRGKLMVENELMSVREELST